LATALSRQPFGDVRHAMLPLVVFDDELGRWMGQGAADPEDEQRRTGQGRGEGRD
jgi:hypothetical protein